MDRRNILKSLAAMPLTALTLGGKQVEAVKVQPGAKYVIFVDPFAVDAEALSRTIVEPSHPLAGAPIVCVHLGRGQSIHDAVAIYELDPQHDSVKENHDSELNAPLNVPRDPA